MKACSLCRHRHQRDDHLCAQCREFHDYWYSLTPDQQQREQKTMDDYTQSVTTRSGSGE